MGKLWGFGTSAIDFRIITADYGDNYRDKLLAQHTFCLGGGAVSNCLVQASRLGGKVGWLGKLGDDILADKIIDMLESENINCSYVIRTKEECSPFNIAIYAGEQKRRIGGFLLPNSLATLKEKDLNLFINPMSADDWLAIEIGEIPVRHCIALAQKAKHRGVHIALDVDLDPIMQCCSNKDEINKLFKYADLLIPNINSLSTLYKENNPVSLCNVLYEKYRVPVVVTAGSSGAYYVDKNGQHGHQPAMPVEAKDTVGAGDAFHGGLLYALTEGKSLSDSVLLGTACAAINCTVFGAREGMPNMEQVEKEFKLYGKLQ